MSTKPAFHATLGCEESLLADHVRALIDFASLKLQPADVVIVMPNECPHPRDIFKHSDYDLPWLYRLTLDKLVCGMSTSDRKWGGVVFKLKYLLLVCHQKQYDGIQLLLGSRSIGQYVYVDLGALVNSLEKAHFEIDLSDDST